MEVTPYEVIPDSIPHSKPARGNIIVIATSLASVSVFLGYIALIGHYVSERAAVLARDEVWLPEGVVIPLTQPNYIGLTIAFSFVTVWWAVSAARNEDKSNALIAYALTLLFGFAYMIQTAYLLSLMDLDLAGSERAVLIYSLILAHVMLMIAAMGYIFISGLRVLSGDYLAKKYEGVTGSAIFWTVISVLYGVLWYTIYITK